MLKAKVENLTALLNSSGLSVWAIWKATGDKHWAYQEFIHAKNNTGALSANQRQRRLQQFADALGVQLADIAEDVEEAPGGEAA